MTLPEFPADHSGYPENSQATLAVGLGIMGIFLTIFAPIAWWLANRELGAIESGRRPPENRGTARAARVLGIIGTVLFAIGLLLVVVVLAVFPASLGTG